MFWPFDPTPGAEDECKDRICACVVLYAPFPLIWYAKWLLSDKEMFWPFIQISGAEGCVKGQNMYDYYQFFVYKTYR